MNTRKPLYVILASTLAATTMSLAACGDKAKSYTITFDTNGGTEISPITAVGGSVIYVSQDPKKPNGTFVGWYTDAEFTGEPIVIPEVMPDKNVTYYAKFEVAVAEYSVVYEYNLGAVAHTGEIASVKVKSGESVVVADGKDYNAEGYKFLGWSKFLGGTVSSYDKYDGQVNVGDSVTVTDGDIKLYAQWASLYVGANEQDKDKIYVYRALMGNERGAAILVREGKPDLSGFAKSGNSTASGFDEFVFYGDEFAGGELSGVLRSDKTYALADGLAGKYAKVDYERDAAADKEYVLELDGYGNATYTEPRGDGYVVRERGKYKAGAKAGEYDFEYLTDMQEIGDKPGTASFKLTKNKSITGFVGSFKRGGDEKGEMTCVVNGEEVSANKIVLDGYGDAVLTEGAKTYRGSYVGTAETGVWKFKEKSGPLEFTFMSNGAHYTKYDGTMYDENNRGNEGRYGALELGCYGDAVYSFGDLKYGGEYVYEDGSAAEQAEPGFKKIVKFTPYGFLDIGELVAIGGEMTFKVYSDHTSVEKIADGRFEITGDTEKTITKYKHDSVFVEFDGVKRVANNAFDYSKNKNKASLVAVKLPNGLLSIGKDAFKSDGTLRRVIIQDPTPLDLGFTAGNDPFSGAADDFAILVPQSYVDVYKDSWAYFSDKIRGIEDEQVISGDVLVAYRGTAQDIVLDARVKSIAYGVFADMNITSIDLKNVETVGAYAFYNCTSLVTIKADKVKTIAEGAFFGCASLAGSAASGGVKLPAIEEIGLAAFCGCTSLGTIELGAELVSIEALAFYECNIDSKKSVTVVLAGDYSEDAAQVPLIGENVTLGNSNFRFKVKNIDSALKLYKAPAWSAYAYDIRIDSVASIAGEYVCGDSSLVLGENAVYMGRYRWLYKLDGEKVTFYEYSASGYNTYAGTISSDKKISVKLGNTLMNFVPLSDEITYKSSDGKYTLVCNPVDIFAETYEAGTVGRADATLNGKAVKLVVADSGITVYNFVDEDRDKYDLTILFNGDYLVVRKKPSPRIVYAQSDNGEYVELVHRDGMVLVNSLIVRLANGIEINVMSGDNIKATQDGSNYTLSLWVKNARYTIKISITDIADIDTDKFAYTYEIKE